MSVASLPKEIFIEIVEILVLPHNDQRAVRLNTLRLVCRQWDELIQQTPLLWTYIWNGTNNTYVERALQRSGTLGLKVRVSLWPKVKNRDKERFWSALLPHVDRWEHAELSGRIGDSIPEALVHTAAPRLRSLALDSRGAQAIDGLFPWPLPNLESLRIQDFGVPWSPQHFPSARLKHLYVDINNRDAANSVPLHMQIFDVLRGCQDLISLHLTGIHFLGDTPDEKLAPIILPSLESISIGSLPRSVECRLLETIHIPKCRVMVIRPAHYGTFGQVLMALENLATRIGTNRIPNRVALEAQKVGCWMQLGCQLKAVNGGGSFMRLRLQHAFLPYHGFLEDAGPFFHRFCGLFGPTCGWDVRVTSVHGASVASMLSAYASHFPTALTLTITDLIIYRSHSEPLLILYDQQKGPAFPCLEQLELWYCKAFARGTLRLITERVIRQDTPGVAPLRMRIKVPKDIGEVERVELAWLEDQVPNLTIETATIRRAP